MENNQVCSCGQGCLLPDLVSKAFQCSARIKDPAATVYRDENNIYFPIHSTDSVKHKWLGSYSNRQYEALKMLKDDPINGIVPVTELCRCCYGIRIIKGKLFFNANTIPACFSHEQLPLLDDRQEKLSWHDLAKWSAELISALQKLHERGIAHGDITVFNIMVDSDNCAHWIDLENLNFDPLQIDHDTASFIFHVLLFAAENLNAIPENFWEEMRNTITGAADSASVLDALFHLVTAPVKLIPAEQQSIRQSTLDLLNSLGTIAEPSEFLRHTFSYLSRSAVYFQKDFLWCVNWNCKLGHPEQLEVSSIHKILKGMGENLAKMEIMREDIQWSLNLEREKSRQLQGEIASLINTSSELIKERKKNTELTADLENEKEVNCTFRKENDRLNDEIQAADIKVGQLTRLVQKLSSFRTKLEENEQETARKNSENDALKELLSQLRAAMTESPDPALAAMLDEGLEKISTLNSVPDYEQLNVPDENITISVVLPVYNQADMVAQSINSVLAQDYSNWELIIVNDGSTDNLDEVVAPYLSDGRIHYLKQHNQRLPKALSNGFAFTSGNLLTWTSADNIMHPQMLRRLCAFLRQNPGVAMVYADYNVIDNDGNPLSEEWFRPHNKRHPHSSEIHLPRTVELLNVVQDNFIGASFMYNRSAMLLIGDYDPQLGIEDYDYWMRINSLMKISHLGTDELLYSYRVHNNSLSAKAKELKITEKCTRLMSYEEKRHTFYYKPFDIYGLYQKSDLIYENFPVNFHGCNYTGNDLPGAFDKRILLVKGHDLASYTPAELRRYNFIGVFFAPGEANDIGRNAYLIRRFGLRCFAMPGSEESRRLQAVTPHVLECLPAEMGYCTMVAANNYLFFRATHTEAELERILPRVPENNPGRIIVLLEHIGCGGMEQVAYDMVKNFNASGRETLLVSLNGKDPDAVIPPGIGWIDLSGGESMEKFRELLTAAPVYAVVSHYCPAGAKESFEAGIPFFQVIHNNYVWFDAENIEKYTRADQYTVGYIAVSANAAWYAMEVMKLIPEKMIIVENGVEFDRFNFSGSGRNSLREKFGFTDDNFVLVNPASCYGTKGQLNLVLAFAQAYRKNPELRLIMAGKIMEESYLQKIQSLIRDLELEKVIFTDCFFDDMAELYSAADAVVLASFWEGCSLAAAEAIHLRRPLLATKVGDIQRQTDYRNCVLVDLPLDYLTDLRWENYGQFIYMPNQPLIDALEDGIHRICSGDYPRDEYPEELSAGEVYNRYLKILNYYRGGFQIRVIRHNI